MKPLTLLCQASNVHLHQCTQLIIQLPEQTDNRPLPLTLTHSHMHSTTTVQANGDAGQPSAFCSTSTSCTPAVSNFRRFSTHALCTRTTRGDRLNYKLIICDKYTSVQQKIVKVKILTISIQKIYWICVQILEGFDALKIMLPIPLKHVTDSCSDVILL